MHKALADDGASAVPIRFIAKEDWRATREGLPAVARRFVEATGFEAACGEHAIVADESGAPSLVLFGIGAKSSARDPFLPGKLANALPSALNYRFESGEASAPGGLDLAVLGWMLSAYRFSRRETAPTPAARLVPPSGVDIARLERIAAAIAFARDLINAPANELGPEALEQAAHDLASAHGARFESHCGSALLSAGFPLVHAVGSAAQEEPRLVSLAWGPRDGLKVALVGKGVCFDTGGLDIKPGSAMSLMKKDMAGAAVALAVGSMIMKADLPVRLNLVLPIVENAISSRSFRPGDILASRRGLRVEIGNTDAEGRLILADALAFAEEGEPELMFDFATLTGAARVALGPDLPPVYARQDDFAAEIVSRGDAVADPVWRLPLWQAYDSLLDSRTADINNVAASPFAGSIVAALFLARFVNPQRKWAHFDIYGWNPTTKPGRPEGGEAQTARLVYELIERRCARAR